MYIACHPPPHVLTILQYSRQVFGQPPIIQFILLIGAELFHVKRRTDGHTDCNLIAGFREFVKASKKLRICTSSYTCVYVRYELHRISATCERGVKQKGNQVLSICYRNMEV
jgi:hypothetical protein